MFLGSALLDLLKRRKVSAALVCVTSTLLAYLVWSLMPRTYTSEAIVGIGLSSASVSVAPQNEAARVLSQIAIIRSAPVVVRAAAQVPEMQKTTAPSSLQKLRSLVQQGTENLRLLLLGEPPHSRQTVGPAYEDLVSNLSVEVIPRTNLIRIAYSSRNRVLALGFASAVVTSYLERQKELIGSSDYMASLLDEQQRAQARITSLLGRLREASSELIGSNAPADRQEFERLRHELGAAESLLGDLAKRANDARLADAGNSWVPPVQIVQPPVTSDRPTFPRISTLALMIIAANVLALAAMLAVPALLRARTPSVEVAPVNDVSRANEGRQARAG